MSDLLQRVYSLTQRQATQSPERASAAAGAGEAPAVRPAGTLASVAAEALTRLSSLSVASGSESGADGCDDGATPTASQAQQAAVGALRELCALQGASDAFLLHVLVGEGGDNVEVRGLKLEASAAAQPGLWQPSVGQLQPATAASVTLPLPVCPTGRSGVATRVPRPRSSSTSMAAGAAATAAGAAAGAAAGGGREAGGEKGDCAALPAAGAGPIVWRVDRCSRAAGMCAQARHLQCLASSKSRPAKY